MASPSDILTVARQIAQALQTTTQNFLNVQGAQSKSGITIATVLKTSPGRLCTVIVTTAGSTTGIAYDAAAAGVTTNPIFVIPNTVGVYVVNMPTNLGIAVTPGTGQVLAVSFS